MQTNKTTFHDLMSGTGKQLYCPPLQRPYEWGEQQWRDLYFDLRAAADLKQPHFFGTLILTTAAPEGGVKRHMLIDGQQRLTTLALLLARGELELGSREDVSDEHDDARGSVRRVLKNKAKDPSLAWRVWPTAGDQADFKTAMSGGSPPKGSRFHKACQWFDALFRDLEAFPSADALAAFLEGILDQGMVVSIEMDDTDDVCAVFSSINGKGKPLAQIDLLKNILLMRSGEDVNTAYERYWLPFEKDLKRKDIDSVLRKMVLAEHGWCNSAVTLDTLLRLPFAQHGQLKELHSRLMEWKREHQYVAAGLPAGDFTRATVTVLKRIRRIVPVMQAQSLSLLEGLFLLNRRQHLAEDSLRDALDVVENYVLRTCLTDNQTTRDSYKAMPQVLKLRHDAVPEALARLLFAENKTYKDSTDERLLSTLMRMDSKLRKAWVRAALLRIEEDHYPQVEFSDPSLEHVMPQSLQGARQWTTEVSPDVPHRIGNLTILHRPYNSDLGRASYAEKRDALGKSRVWLNEYFETVEKWGPDEVDARTKALHAQFVKVLPTRMI